MLDKINVKIPDLQPYEGKATQKQKQKLWDMGYEDQSVINTLGKRQASALIEQLVNHQKGNVSAWKWFWLLCFVAIIFFVIFVIKNSLK